MTVEDRKLIEAAIDCCELVLQLVRFRGVHRDDVEAMEEATSAIGRSQAQLEAMVIAARVH